MDSYNMPFGETNFVPEIISEIANDEIIDPYLNATYISDFGLNLNAGLRLNNHSEYGSHFVYNFNPSFVFKKDNKTYKLLTSISSAYLTPSLYQLFAPYYGNSDLKPQEDTTIEAGIAYYLDDKLSISALYFNRDQNSFIDYVILDYVTYAGEYQNLDDDYKVNGVELELNYNPFSNIEFSANYTFTERKNADLFRIPKHKVNASIDFDFKSKTYVSLNYQYNSDRISPYFNDDFTANRSLKSYSLVNLSFNQVVIKERLKVFASVSNLFNEDYEELYHFSTLGRNYKLGLSLNF
jgi:vitamin B12 transporter